MSEGPRILVTGFGPFPGAPDNPTAWLVEKLAANTAQRGRGLPPSMRKCSMSSMILSARASRHSATPSRPTSPFISVWLPRRPGSPASNVGVPPLQQPCPAPVPDNAGRLPPSFTYLQGPDTLPSTLPLEAIAELLTTAGLPVQWSDDAGGYLCNTVFVLSRFHACKGLRPAMSGFVHVAAPDRAERCATGGYGCRRSALRGAHLVIAATLAAHKG